MANNIFEIWPYNDNSRFECLKSLKVLSNSYNLNLLANAAFKLEFLNNFSYTFKSNSYKKKTPVKIYDPKQKSNRYKLRNNQLFQEEKVQEKNNENQSKKQKSELRRLEYKLVK